MNRVNLDLCDTRNVAESFSRKRHASSVLASDQIYDAHTRYFDGNCNSIAFLDENVVTSKSYLYSEKFHVVSTNVSVAGRSVNAYEPPRRRRHRSLPSRTQTRLLRAARRPAQTTAQISILQPMEGAAGREKPYAPRCSTSTVVRTSFARTRLSRQGRWIHVLAPSFPTRIESDCCLQEDSRRRGELVVVSIRAVARVSRSWLFKFTLRELAFVYRREQKRPATEVLRALAKPRSPRVIYLQHTNYQRSLQMRVSSVTVKAKKHTDASPALEDNPRNPNLSCPSIEEAAGREKPYVPRCSVLRGSEGRLSPGYASRAE